MAWGSSTIKVPAAELIEAAKKMQQYADACADIFDRIDNSLNSLAGSGQWRGDSMKAIKSVTEGNKGQYAYLTNDLNNLAGILEKFAQQMQEEDQTIAREIGKA